MIKRYLNLFPKEWRNIAGFATVVLVLGIFSEFCAGQAEFYKNLMRHSMGVKEETLRSYCNWDALKGVFQLPAIVGAVIITIVSAIKAAEL